MYVNAILNMAILRVPPLLKIKFTAVRKVDVA